MKVLGVTFDSGLKWDSHGSNVISRAKKSLNGIGILRRNLGAHGFTKILTAQFFSKMYYGATVWLHQLLSRDTNRIESPHYAATRIGCHDYRNKISRDILDHDYMIARCREIDIVNREF
jgi:hypothetical protein